jgi:DNA-binding response OmpR family regulator
MAARILIADDDASFRQLLQVILEEHGFDVITVPSGEALVRAAITQQPDLILIDIMMPGMDGLEALRQLRNDTRTSHLPMLLVTSLQAITHEVIGFESGADDYIVKPFEVDAMIARIKASLRRQARIPLLNPLTQMPGNKAIADEVERRIHDGSKFALCWIDLDNFKALNDAYGFARGDRVIKLLAEILRDLQRKYSEANVFVGHLGGDDFVAFAAPEAVEAICNELIARFDYEVRAFYDPSDAERGFIRGVDRFGVPRRFPIVSVSIGIATNETRSFQSYDEVSTVATEVKNYAKKHPGSMFAVDGRFHDQPIPPEEERRGQVPLVAVVSQDHLVYDALQPLLNAGRCRGVHFREPPPLNALLDQLPDLVTLHVGDPRCWALAVAIQESKPVLPMIMISPRSEDETRAYATGAYLFIPSPFPDDYYRACVAQLLRLNERLALPRSA